LQAEKDAEWDGNFESLPAPDDDEDGADFIGDDSTS